MLLRPYAITGKKMDVTSYLELKIAPRAIFDTLAARGSRVRYMLPEVAGGWRSVTWAQHAEHIRCVALFLNAHGFQSGERAAVFAPNRLEWIEAALAIQAAGGVMVPVYPNSTAEQAAYIIEHSDATALFVDTPELLGRVLEVWSELKNLRRIVLLDDSVDVPRVLASLRKERKDVPSYVEVERKLYTWTRASVVGKAVHAELPEAFGRLLDSVSLEQPGLMLYTSGTTGQPKGVPLTHRNVAINGRDWLTCNGPLVEEGDVDLLWLPMSHIFGFGEACLGNTLGFTTYLCDPYTVLGCLPEVRPHVFMSVPRYWEKLASAAMGEGTADDRRRRLAEVTGGNLRFCLSGGAGLKQEVKELFYACGLLIIEGYGLTEASPTLTLNRPNDFRFDSVGKPLPSLELVLAKDGEILAKGGSVFGGYHKGPEATAATFTEDGWLKTGDIGRFTDDGFLQIIDRKKEILVSSAGKNIPPSNLEVRFADDPCFAHVVVYGDAKSYLVAGIWLLEDELRRRLKMTPASPEWSEAVEGLVKSRVESVNAELARYETIKKWAIMDKPLTVENELLTATLKIRRKKIYAEFKEQFEAMYT